MLRYVRIGIYEGIDVNKSNESRRCVTCNHYFLKVNFKFQPKVCDGCHNLIQTSVRFNNAAIVCAKGNNHRTHFWYVSNNKQITFSEKLKMKNSVSKQKSGSLLKHKKLKLFLSVHTR